LKRSGIESYLKWAAARVVMLRDVEEIKREAPEERAMEVGDQKMECHVINQQSLIHPT
jgi:predicted nucleotidyltransferase